MKNSTAATRRHEALVLEHERSSIAPGSPTAATILIVDDDIKNRKVVEVMLRAEGYLTLGAATGEEALASIAERAPDLILLDVMMPGMDGYQVADKLKANPATSSIPIIMVTAKTDRSARLAGLNAGAEEFLTKPVERSELWLRVRNLLRLKAFSDFLRNHGAILEQQVQARTESLRASESRFRQLAENIRDVFFLVDAENNRMLYISRAYEEIWGRSCESVYENAESWIEAIHPEDRASTWEKYSKGMVTGTFDLEYRIVRPDGSIRWMETRGFPVRDDAGKIVRVAGIAEEITERKQAESQLRESRQRLDGIVTSAMDAIVTVDENERIELCNPAAERMFGYAVAELQGQPLHLLIPERFRASHSASVAAFGKAGATSRRMGALRPVSGLRKNGAEFPIEASISKHESTGRLFFTAILRDITERTKSEERIRRLNRLYAVLSGINTLIVRVHDRDELFKEACRITVEAGAFKMAWIGVIDPQTLDGRVVAWYGGEEGYVDLIRLTARGDTPDSERPACRALRQSQPVICNDIATDPSVALLRDELLRRGHKSAGCFPLMVAGRPEAVICLFAGDSDVFDDEETRLLLELAGDISFALDHIEKAEKLNYLAYYDVLTGLANRTLFLERLAQRSAVSGGHKVALCLIDLERFKNINDTLGRPAGDALLRQVAQWLTQNMGDANLLARVGADHFAMVVPEVAQEADVARLLEKSMQAFGDHPFRLNDAVFRIAAKIGVALFPDDGGDADTLFRNAEAALKKAKASGDRYLFYTQKMTEAVAGKLTLENQLRQALDKEEFVLHYQPKVNLASGKLSSVEALIRWNDPRTGLVPPGRFIPVLEETGLIYEVGRWALRKAIEEYLRWRAAGLAAVRIAVNVSPLQLRNRGFIAEIEQAIGIDPHAAAGLELEITESLIMEDVKHNIASLQAIRAMGVTIAIDDFGTGFSSLSYLSKLPVDTLKIDRSFVIDMTAGPDGLSLVSTIITLAHSLKLKVVAEGVETEEQSRVLRLLKCDEMQGYLFSKPVPSETFETRFLTPVAAG